MTRAVYVQEIKDAERRARRRGKMEARYGSVLEAMNRNGEQSKVKTSSAEIVDLSSIRNGRQ